MVDELVDHWPASCDCGHVFAAAEQVACREPARHQVEELPQIAVRVTEHRCQRLRCPDCGVARSGELPAEVARSAFGPRLQAAVVALSVRNRVSRRDLVELCEELFGARISVGSIDAILARAGDALEQPYEQLLSRMRRSRALNVDETGWRLKGGQRTLWGTFTEKIAVFKITANRHEQHLRELLADHQGIVTSDRWWAYDHLPLARRQICWSHLQRDFQAQAEGSGAEHELGTAGLRICERLFWAWEVYQHTHDRRQLQLEIRALRRELKPILRQYRGKAPHYKRSRGLARNLLKAWPALWTFTDRPGVTPTNKAKTEEHPPQIDCDRAIEDLDGVAGDVRDRSLEGGVVEEGVRRAEALNARLDVVADRNLVAHVGNVSRRGRTRPLDVRHSSLRSGAVEVHHEHAVPALGQAACRPSADLAATTGDDCVSLLSFLASHRASSRSCPLVQPTPGE